MTGNYDSIHGVQYRRFGPDHQDNEPPDTEESCELDEMYYDNGQLRVTFQTSDGFLSFAIPVYPVERWGEFVQSLVGSLR